MKLMLSAALAVAVAAPPAAFTRSSTGPAAGQGTDLSARLVGSWHGRRTTPISLKPQTFTMTWRKSPAGHLAGEMVMPGEPQYALNLVWSSDTAFIYESAPHMSHLLHAKVVTRGVVHFKGNELLGKFEARPTRFEGKTISGTFTAGRSA